MNEQQLTDQHDQPTEDYGFSAPPAPSNDVRALDRLVGTWRVTGGAEGEVTYSWLEGGYFLVQKVRLEQFGQTVKGVEIIGNLRPYGEGPGTDVVSRFYDDTGNTLDYVYELVGDTLTIWAGAKGAPAKFVGTFEPTGDVLVGAWEYPGGGGYESTMARVSA